VAIPVVTFPSLTTLFVAIQAFVAIPEVTFLWSWLLCCYLSQRGYSRGELFMSLAILLLLKPLWLFQK